MSDSRTVNNKKTKHSMMQEGANTSTDPKNVKNDTKVKKRKKQRKTMDQVVNKGLKSSSGFALGLLVNLIIVFLVVKIFSFSFNFTYSVFGNCVYEPGTTTYKVVEIPADSSILEIGAALQEAEVIESKYVFFAKVKVKGYGNKIQAGQYGLSASMSLEEILNIICHITDEEDL